MASGGGAVAGTAQAPFAARVLRYRAFVVVLLAVLAISYFPAADESADVEQAATGAGPTAGDAQGAVESSATTLAAASPGERAPGDSPIAVTAGDANPGELPTAAAPANSRPVASGGHFGTPEALSAPDCDRGRQRIKVPTPWAPPCAIPWPEGADNGGATSRGVTKDKVRVVVTYADDPQNDPRKAWPDEAAAYEHAYRLWGRTVEVVYFLKSGADEASQRADALKIADLKPFAVWVHPGGSATLVLNQELAARGMIVITPNSGAKYSLASPGYIWGASLPSSDPNLLHITEYVGKRLVGKLAKWAGNPSFQTQERKFGLIYPDEWELGQFRSELARHGGSIVDAISYKISYDLAAYQEQARVIVARLKSKGVNSVIAGSDGVLNILLTKEATQQAWFPEWVIAAVGGSDVDLLARLSDQQQWSHAFGLSMLVTPVQGNIPPDMFEWYWGNQAGERTRGSTTLGIQWAVFTLYTGLHMAGPNLTPQTWTQGMFAYPPSGGFSCNCVTSQQISWGRHGVVPYDDYNAWDDFAEVWWDPQFIGRGNDRVADGAPGHYRYMDGGKRRLPGQWPKGEPPAFDKSRAAHYEGRPPNEQVPNYPCEGCPGR